MSYLFVIKLPRVSQKMISCSFFVMFILVYLSIFSCIVWCHTDCSESSPIQKEEVPSKKCRERHVYHDGNCYYRWHIGEERMLWLEHENRKDACERKFYKNRPVVNPDEKLTKYILQDYMKGSDTDARRLNVFNVRVEGKEGKCDCFMVKHQEIWDDDTDNLIEVIHQHVREPCSCESLEYPLCSHRIEDTFE